MIFNTFELKTNTLFAHMGNLKELISCKLKWNRLGRKEDGAGRGRSGGKVTVRKEQEALVSLAIGAHSNGLNATDSCK